MFDSIYLNGFNAGLLFIALGVALLSGFLFAFIVSFRLRTSKGAFIATALMPIVITLSFSLLNVLIKNDTTSVITSVGVAMVALGLIRFRSVNAKAEEMLVLFISTASGAAFGLGYIAYGAIFLIAMGLIYDGFTFIPLFDGKRFSREKLLKITIPESLEYNEVFNEIFAHYLIKYEMVEVKTTGMGSMFRLSYKISMKNPKEEKELIDELRTKNGNLEISILPYVDSEKQL